MKFKLTSILVSEALEDIGSPRSAKPIAIPIDVLCKERKEEYTL